MRLRVQHNISVDINTQVLNETDPLKRFDVGLKLVQRQLLVLGAAGSLIDKEAATRDVIKLKTRREGDDANEKKGLNERGSSATVADEDEDEEDTVRNFCCVFLCLRKGFVTVPICSHSTCLRSRKGFPPVSSSLVYE